MKSWLLVGNFGVGNLGDEALKEYFLTAFPEVEWKVLSAQPTDEEYSRFPAGISSFLRMKWLKTWKALRKSEGIVFGGGSLFTDAEYVRACFVWWIHSFFAHLAGKKVVFAFQGIGPFHTKIGEWFTRSALRHATYISVRDPLSTSRAERLTKNTKIIQSFDPVFALIKNKYYESRTQKILIVIPRFNSGKIFLKSLQELLAMREWEGVHILSMQSSDPRERDFCTNLESLLHGRAQYREVRSVSDLLREVAQGSSVLTERYHGGIVAVALGKDLHVIAQKDGDKLSTLRSVKVSDVEAAIKVGENSLQGVLY